MAKVCAHEGAKCFTLLLGAGCLVGCPLADVDVHDCPAWQCTTDADCNDGLFCNGEEWCDLAACGICRAGSPPCGEPPEDTANCDEELDVCLEP